MITMLSKQHNELFRRLTNILGRDRLKLPIIVAEWLSIPSNAIDLSYIGPMLGKVLILRKLLSQSGLNRSEL
jgi:hypothetical protein